MPSADPQHCVRGQYQGYADVPGVASGSATETFLALRLEIDNWRWADVPIFLRAGKALPHKVTEVRLLLRRTPRLAFLPEPTRAEPNQIVLRIDPDPGLRQQLSALAGQSWRTVHVDTSFARELGEPPEPYEVLLHAAMVGRPPILRPGGQRRGDLAHRAAAARPPARRPPLPARILGTRRGGNPAPRPPALAAAVAARGGLSP